MLDRPLYQPTPAEVQAACETLLQYGLSQEARQVAISRHAEAARDCARTMLALARNAKTRGDQHETTRLIQSARWHWHWYIREIAR